MRNFCIVMLALWGVFAGTHLYGQPSPSMEELPELELPQAASSDPQLELLAMQACQFEKHGRPVKVILTDSHWHIRKNTLGVPERKYMGFSIVTEKGGKCYLLPGAIRKEYAGGGRYRPESVKVIDSVRQRTEIHCNKVR